jgi:hypothetical protein
MLCGSVGLTLFSANDFDTSMTLSRFRQQQQQCSGHTLCRKHQQQRPPR